MHEMSITESMLALALEKAGEASARKITRINLVVGELSGVVEDSVRFYFEFIRKDTLAREAELNFETRPTVLKCRKCGHTFTPADHAWACPQCADPGADIISGRECFMTSIEVE